MKNFKFNIPTQIYFGVDILEQIGDIAKEMGKKALIVTGGSSSKKTGLLDRVIKLLNQKGVNSVVFDKVTPNPLATTVQDGVSVAKKEECDFIIGVGGGSSIDAAKAIAFCCVSPGHITDYFPGEKYFTQGPTGALPLIAVTTTSGTGSEANKVAVITDAKTNRKVGIRSIYGYPTVAIVDPKLMITVPPEVTAATGVDVLYHAVESYLSKNAHAFSEMCSIEAIKLVVANLEKAVRDGSDIEARANLAWANTLAGIAIDNVGTIAIHGTSHPVSAYYNSVHGKALSAVAPTYFKYYYNLDIKKCAKFAELLGCKTDGLTDEQLAAKSSEYLDNFLESIGMKITLGELGVTDDMIKTLTNNAFETMAGAIGNTPGKMEYEDIYRLYKESL
jgi:alcohol dehydrogenase